MIFLRKQPMKIEDMFFSDGQVKEYNFNSDELEMLFVDSSESQFRLSFSGSIEVEERESINLSIYESHLDRESDTTKLRLLDDDLREMLTIRFRASQVKCVSPQIRKEKQP